MPTIKGLPDPATHVPLMDRLRALGPGEQDAYLAALTPDELRALTYDFYGTWARPAQIPPPGDWTLWLIQAGRGFGKTRAGQEVIRYLAETGQADGLIGLIARTGTDARAVMVEGPSGILQNAHPAFRPTWEPSKRQLTWPNGVQAITYSADRADQLRGPQFSKFWGDEPASWPGETRLGELDAFDNALMCLRAGQEAWGLLTGTPKPSAVMRKILAHPGLVRTGGPTRENAANLAGNFLAYIVAKYAGTRLGLQELEAQILDVNPDALWTMAMIARARRAAPAAHQLRRVSVGVDPEAASTEESAETGIVIGGRGLDAALYVLGDRTVHGRPAVWGRAVVQAYWDYGADRVVAEVNQGGDMIAHVIHQIDPRVPVRSVRATRGKQVRAEPVAALYEQGKAHHCGEFPELEAQLTQWQPGQRSPDRLDALVWMATDAMLHRGAQGAAVAGPIPPGLHAGSRGPGIPAGAPPAPARAGGAVAPGPARGAIAPLARGAWRGYDSSTW